MNENNARNNWALNINQKERRREERGKEEGRRKEGGRKERMEAWRT